VKIYEIFSYLVFIIVKVICQMNGEKHYWFIIDQ